MPFIQFDRTKLLLKPLSSRKNRVRIKQDHIPITQQPRNTSQDFKSTIVETAVRIKKARERNASVILAMGAHTIKNGMAPTLIQLMEEGWLTHLATNGAGIIHDWEFAFQGESSEDVRANVAVGQFGIWEETGKYINLALLIGAYEGKGYGESVGSMIHHEGVRLPTIEEIISSIKAYEKDPERAAAALDLYAMIKKINLKAGWLSIRFPYKDYCVQAAAYRLGIPFTGHPMIGHDIIYTHPMNHGGALGRVALKDFLFFANAVNHLDYGVYLSIGSAVMSPMIFEKSLSMAQNLHIQQQKHIDHHYMLIVDLADSKWDWQRNGEPPPDDPAYYLRFLKTFNRMGGTMKYLSADNRDFLLALYHELNKLK
jgi:hypothetical protein